VLSSRWTARPTREALSHLGVERSRIALGIAVPAALSDWAVSSAYASGAFDGRWAVLPPASIMAMERLPLAPGLVTGW
jgi:hypothetical protein